MGGLAHSLARLSHAALPSMEIVVHNDRNLFICEKIIGVSLEKAAIRDESLLTSVGLQLCSLFSGLGDLQEAFRWLKYENIIIDESGKVRIDVVGHFKTSTCDEHASLKQDDIWAPIFLFGFGEVEVVAAIGRALWSAVTGDRSYLPCHLEYLFRCWPSLFPSLATLIAAVANQHSISPFVETLSELQNYLNDPPPSAKARISSQYVDFGNLVMGEISKRSIRLSSLTPGLLYGEISHETQGLSVFSSAFSGRHPCHWDIEVELSTNALMKHGQNVGQITILTPMETFHIATKVDVRSTKK